MRETSRGNLVFSLIFRQKFFRQVRIDIAFNILKRYWEIFQSLLQSDSIISLGINSILWSFIGKPVLKVTLTASTAAEL